MTEIQNAQHVATVTKGATIRVDLDESFGPLLDELAEVTHTLNLAKARDKEIKTMILAEAGYTPDPDDLDRVFMIYVAGGLRKKIRTQQRTGTDEKLLLEAFPEAHAATRKATTFGVVANA